jgi:hypothetical protein
MNLTTDEAAKVIVALERISKVKPIFPDDRYGDGGVLQRAKTLASETLAILQAAKDRQPYDMDDRLKLVYDRLIHGGREVPDGVLAAYVKEANDKLKDRPQPEPVAWMHEQHKDVQSAEWVTYWRLEGLKFPNGANADGYNIPLYTHPPQPAVDKLIEAGDEVIRTYKNFHEAIKHDTGKPYPWCPMEIALDAWDAAKSAAPAKVDVDAVVEVVRTWRDQTFASALCDEDRDEVLRARLTKLFNATT